MSEASKKANKKYLQKKKDVKIAITFILEENELWKPIDGHEKYRITNNGRVYSTIGCKFLTPHLGDNGYFSVGLSNRKHMTIHRLLGIHFIENPDNKSMIDHIDRNRTNNNLSNLRWVNCSENNCNKAKKGSIGINKRTINGKTYEYIKVTWYISTNTRKNKNFKTLEDAREFLNNLQL